jgi:beta-glucanase (GH16 family)
MHSQPSLPMVSRSAHQRAEDFRSGRLSSQGRSLTYTRYEVLRRRKHGDNSCILSVVSTKVPTTLPSIPATETE